MPCPRIGALPRELRPWWASWGPRGRPRRCRSQPPEVVDTEIFRLIFFVVWCFLIIFNHFVGMSQSFFVFVKDFFVEPVFCHRPMPFFSTSIQLAAFGWSRQRGVNNSTEIGRLSCYLTVWNMSILSSSVYVCPEFPWISILLEENSIWLVASF